MELTAKNLGPWLGVVLILVCALGLVVPLFTAGTRKAGLQELERYHDMLCAERIKRGSYPEEFKPPETSIDLLSSFHYQRIDATHYRVDATLRLSLDRTMILRMIPNGIDRRSREGTSWKREKSFDNTCNTD